MTSSAGSDIASATVSNHSCTITPSGRDRPATAILSVTMSEPVVSAARTTASWPCGLGLAGSAESSGLMNTGFLSGVSGITADVGNVSDMDINRETTTGGSGVLGSVGDRGMVNDPSFCGATSTSGGIMTYSSAISSDVLIVLWKVSQEWLTQGGMSVQALVWHYLLVRVVLVEGRSME